MAEEEGFVNVIVFSQGMKTGLIHPEKQGPGPIDEER